MKILNLERPVQKTLSKRLLKNLRKIYKIYFKPNDFNFIGMKNKSAYINR